MNIFSRVAVVEAQITAMEKALELASMAMNKRLDGMNDFRRALIDQQATLLSKDVYATEHKALTTKTDKNAEAIRDLQTAKNSWMQAWMIIAGIVAAVGSAATMFALFVHK